MFFPLAILSFLSIFSSPTIANPVSLSPTPQISPRRQTLFDCLSAHNVPTKLTSSPDWNTFIQPYNLRLSYVPAAVTLPTTEQHVSDSVLCASAAGIKVQAKSGGHSYASFSSGGQDGSLIVDLQNFNTIDLDNASGIAMVGPGVRLGNLAQTLYYQSKRALPHGTCPGVGVGGHLTHGGYGHDSRLWGLALDTIVRMDAVLANGTSVCTSATDYPDLFFALRGAADSIAIVTKFYLQTLPAPDSIVNFAISIPATLSSADTAANSFLKLQEFVLESEYVSGNISFGIYTDGTAFSLGGWYFGGLDFFNNIVLPAMLGGFPTAHTTTVKSLGWIDSLKNEAEGPLDEPLTGYNAHDTFYAKSITTREGQPLTRAALYSFFSYVITTGRSAPSPWFSIINLYGGKGSAINAVPPSTSAYSDRDSLWVFQVSSTPYLSQSFVHSLPSLPVLIQPTFSTPP